MVPPDLSSDSDEDYTADEYDSQAENECYQELLATGLLKPGLNVAVEKKQYKNEVQKIKEIQAKIEKKNLPWVERLDIISEPAPLAPELAVELKDQEEKMKSGRSNELALNEFKRESLFHRQAQYAVEKGIALLKAEGLPTVRPLDYYAEMMKTDKHMQKVRRSLLEKQSGLKQAEKLKEMRKNKKLAKQKQISVLQEKQKEKRKLNEEIKKYRKGHRSDLDFLDSKPSGKKPRERDESNKKEHKKFNKSRNNKKSERQDGNKKSFKSSKKFRPGKERRKNMKSRN